MVSPRESQIITPAMNLIRKIQRKEIAKPEDKNVKMGTEKVKVLLMQSPAKSSHLVLTTSERIFSAIVCRFRSSMIALIESITSPKSTFVPSPFWIS